MNYGARFLSFIVLYSFKFENIM